MTIVIASTFRQVADDLRRLNTRWALVGGLAVSARSTPRFTADIDIAVSVQTDTEAERIVRGLTAQGYQPFATVEQDATGRLATARLHPPDRRPQPNIVLDLLFASSGIEPEIVEHASVLEIMESTHVPTAALGHLLALKVLSHDDGNRPQDRMDAMALQKNATAADLELARKSLQLITERGFNRDRDLLRLLDELLAGR